MISWLSKWAQGIIVAVIIATLIELILPNGSSKKYVKVVIGVYILFTIISPVIEKLKNDDFGINEILNTQKYEEELAKSDNTISAKLESNNSRIIKDIYISNLTIDIQTKLKEKGYEVISANIKIKDDENYTIEKIIINLNKIENEKNEKDNIENVNIEKIQIKENNATNNINENAKTLTESQKKEIKDYLSKTYDIDAKNIEIS